MALLDPLPLQWGLFLRGGGGDGSFQAVWNEQKVIAQSYWPWAPNSIYICISFHKLGLGEHSMRKKVLLLYIFQDIKPLHCTVGSPMSSQYEGLVHVSLAQKDYTLSFCFVLTEIDSLVLAQQQEQRKGQLQNFFLKMRLKCLHRYS